ncbi:MAG: enoyl-CoA hydratase/isomerase family protein [Acidimicrobiia bacterium]
MTVAVSEPLPGVRQVLLDRPDSRNALDLEMVSELSRLIGETGPGVVILGSSSRDALSAGVDLGLPDAERAEVSRALYGLYQQMRSTDAIVVAAVTGHAVGGGAQLMLASDIRVASPDLSIRFMGPGHGLAVGAWGLPGLVGRGRAIDLALSMRSVGAEEALAIGLIERIHDLPLEWALDFARHVITLDPEAVVAVKRIVGVVDSLGALGMEREHNHRWSGAIPPSGDVDGV